MHIGKPEINGIRLVLDILSRRRKTLPERVVVASLLRTRSWSAMSISSILDQHSGVAGTRDETIVPEGLLWAPKWVKFVVRSSPGARTATLPYLDSEDVFRSEPNTNGMMVTVSVQLIENGGGIFHKMRLFNGSPVPQSYPTTLSGWVVARLASYLDVNEPASGYVFRISAKLETITTAYR